MTYAYGRRAVGQHVARARDQERASVAQLAEQAKAAGVLA
jgi:hypothetical protein